MMTNAIRRPSMRRWMTRGPREGLLLLTTLAALAGCNEDTTGPEMPLNPATAPRATIDRFSDEAGMLFRRADNGVLPAAGQAIDFDQAPFVTQGLGPDGQVVRYYNFDVMSTTPAPIWVLFPEGGSTPVPGQLNIVDVVPGEVGYNDFWRVMKVTVPADYVANTATSAQDILDAGYEVEATDIIVNCPVVPEGSTADEGPGANGLTMGWYDDQVVFYFDFNEASLTAVAGLVPTAPIFVSFNVNPDEAGGGPASGFMAQGSSEQTHNVVATVPGDAGYSPLWNVFPYDNAQFDDVWNLETAADADNFGVAAIVNCPVVYEGDPPGDPATAVEATIDRFSDAAGMLFRRSGNAALPAAGEAIDFDQGPFITQGLGPDGQVVRYYNFDVMPTTPAPIYAFFYENGDPVPNQLNVVDLVPGDDGYSDFWQVVLVTVPDDYVANTVTSLDGIVASSFETEVTDMIVNCPVVPEGSTADLRLSGGGTGLTRGWYQGELIHYFNFVEAPLTPTDQDAVPTAPIFVTFNINPDQEGGGPPSGFVTEVGSDQTHNVVSTLPGDVGYSPLWDVFPYDNAAFDAVTDLASAQAADDFGLAARVNCPIVFIE
jgi:hypothetical protein